MTFARSESSGAVFIRADRAKRNNTHGVGKPYWGVTWRPWKLLRCETPWCGLGLWLGYGYHLDCYDGFWGISFQFKPNPDRGECAPKFFKSFQLGLRRCI